MSCASRARMLKAEEGRGRRGAKVGCEERGEVELVGMSIGLRRMGIPQDYLTRETVAG